MTLKERPTHHNLGFALVQAGTVRIFRKLRVSFASRQTLRYWKQKALDPSFHSGSWGGRKWSKFSDEDMASIALLIWAKLKRQPCSRIPEFVRMLNTPPWCFGVSLSAFSLLEVVLETPGPTTVGEFK
jgi:hypothetical protein